MKRTHYAYLFMALLSLAACKKDKDEKEPDPVVQANERISTGYDTTFKASNVHTTAAMNVDIDRDGTADFELTSQLVGDISRDKIYNPVSYISTLHAGSSVAVEQVTQNFYMKKMVYSYYEHMDEMVHVDTNYIPACSQLGAEYFRVNTVTEDKPAVHGDSATATSSAGAYKQGRFYFVNTYGPGQEAVKVIKASNDTIFSVRYPNHPDCGRFANDLTFLIYVKVKKNGEDKRGWLRVGIKSMNQLTLLNSAIEK